MLSLAGHQKYLRVMDIKEKDLLEVDSVFLKVRPFFNKIDLGQDKIDTFKQIKSLGIKLVKYLSYRN